MAWTDISLIDINIKAIHFNEIKDACDNLDNTECWTHNAVYYNTRYITHNDSNRSTYRYTEYGTHHNSRYTSVRYSHYAIDKSSNNSGVYSVANISY